MDVQALIALCNIAQHGSRQHLQRMVKEGAIPHMCDQLKSTVVEVQKFVLDFLDLFLASDKLADDKNNTFALYVEEAGGLDRLEEIANDTNRSPEDECASQAYLLLQRYFDGKEMPPPLDNGSPTADGKAEGTAFAFGDDTSTTASSSSVFAFGSESTTSAWTEHKSSHVDTNVFGDGTWTTPSGFSVVSSLSGPSAFSSTDSETVSMPQGMDDID